MISELWPLFPRHDTTLVHTNSEIIDSVLFTRKLIVVPPRLININIGPGVIKYCAAANDNNNSYCLRSVGGRYLKLTLPARSLYFLPLNQFQTVNAEEKFRDVPKQRALRLLVQIYRRGQRGWVFIFNFWLFNGHQDTLHPPVGHGSATTLALGQLSPSFWTSRITKSP